MRCVDACLDELETEGWLVNQTRMWMSSQWTVRGGAEWTEGEDRFFTHLLDGRARRTGSAGSGRSGRHRKPYGFSRWQVRKRRRSCGGRCALRHRCPIEDWPDDPRRPPAPTPSRCCAPTPTRQRRAARARWSTPAGRTPCGSPPSPSATPTRPLDAHPDLPVVFVFDEPLLARLRLSASGWCSSPRPRRPRHAPRRRAAPRPGARGAGRAAPSPSRTRRCRASGRAPRRRAGARAPVAVAVAPARRPDRLLHGLAQAAARR
jgi:hypothetical protein